eukprot:6212600-Pleurochrysis_carterae.AAC.1
MHHGLTATKTQKVAPRVRKGRSLQTEANPFADARKARNERARRAMPALLDCRCSGEIFPTRCNKSSSGPSLLALQHFQSSKISHSSISTFYMILPKAFQHNKSSSGPSALLGRGVAVLLVQQNLHQ